MPNFSTVLKYVDDPRLTEGVAKTMHKAFSERKGSRVKIDGRELVSFVSCSYLGLDSDPRIISAAKAGLEKFGVNYCCARTRLSIEPLCELEAELSRWMGMPLVTFPSVSVTHLAILPLIADGIFSESKKKSLLLFDKFAHASMQSLMPMLSSSAEVQKIPHNDLEALESLCKQNAGRDVYYFCDSLYSMGGVAPLKELFDLSERYGLFLYVDDAHGTSVYGKNGQGYVSSILGHSNWPSRLFVTFSLSKGFGCSGGGVVVPDSKWDVAIRKLSTPYLFSGGIDIANIFAGLESLRIHQSKEISLLQEELRQRVNFYDSHMSVPHLSHAFPIKTIEVKDEFLCLQLGEALMERGFFVSTSFFPVVAKDDAKIRLCLTRDHDSENIAEVISIVKDFLK